MKNTNKWFYPAQAEIKEYLKHFLYANCCDQQFNKNRLFEKYIVTDIENNVSVLLIEVRKLECCKKGYDLLMYKGI